MAVYHIEGTSVLVRPSEESLDLIVGEVREVVAEDRSQIQVGRSMVVYALTALGRIGETGVEDLQRLDVVTYDIAVGATLSLGGDQIPGPYIGLNEVVKVDADHSSLYLTDNIGKFVAVGMLPEAPVPGQRLDLSWAV